MPENFYLYLYVFMYIWDNKKFMLQEFWPRKRAHLREQFKKRRFMEMQMKCCGQKQKTTEHKRIN